MAIANPGGLSFGGASSVAGTGLGTGLGALASSGTGNAAGLSFSGGSASSSAGIGAGTGSVGGTVGQARRQPFDDVTGSIGSGGGGGAPAGAGIGGAGSGRSPTDAYFDPLAGSGLR
ncbi:MAG: hypothetical protein PGN25_19410 [Methylorubrum populi]